MRTRAQPLPFFLVSVALLAGCTNLPRQAEPWRTSPAGWGLGDMDSAMGPGDPAASRGQAVLTLQVHWSERGEAGARTLLDECRQAECVVTGPGIPEPLVARIEWPETSAQLVIPAGSGRQAAFEQLDAAGGHLATTIYPLPDLVGGQAYSLIVQLVDDYEPNNDPAGATLLPSTGAKSAWAVLDDDRDADPVDWYAFTVTDAPNAYAFFLTDVASDGTGGLQMAVVLPDGTTELSEVHSEPADDLTLYHGFSTNGVYFIRVGPYHGFPVNTQYRLVISDTLGEAGVDVTLD